MLIRSIDFETTGFAKPEKPSGVCEVGWADIDIVETTGQRQPFVRSPASIICDPGIPVDPEARAIHHISDEVIANGDHPTLAFGALMEHGPDYFCAHNADHEREYFDGGDTPFICTYKVALRLWPDAPSHSLQVLRYWLPLDIDQSLGLPAHRAGPDAYVGAVLMAEILSHPNAPDLDTMVRWSNGPALLPHINFGKHKGSRWEDVPLDYLRWIVDKSDLDGDVKANARHWIKQRHIKKGRPEGRP